MFADRLILGLGQENTKINLEHLIIAESKAMLKKQKDESMS